MKEINCIAKKDFPPFFKIGDKVQIIVILYKEDTLIRNEIYELFDNNGIPRGFNNPKNGVPKGWEFRKVSDKLYAPKDSYKSSYIKLNDGREFPGTLIKNYSEYFDKL